MTVFDFLCYIVFFFFFSSRRRHTRSLCDWSSDVCSSDLDSHTTPAKRPAAMSRAMRPQLPPAMSANSECAGSRRYNSEIGRASCRERVEHTGGAEARKKKNNRKVM